MPPIDLDSLIAQPGFAPREWQSKMPDKAYKTRGVAVKASPDLTRITNLPRRSRPTDHEAKILVDRLPDFIGPNINGIRSLRRVNNNCRCAALFEEHGMKGRECITSLRAIQSWALLEMHTVGGLLGLIGVGHGKTFLDLLTPWAVKDCKTALLLVPPKLVEQLDRDYDFLNEHFHLPSITFHSRKGEDRLKPGRPCLHVLPYSVLNRPDASTYIEKKITPDLIIADEVHKLKNANTATTGRVLRYFHSHPETRFCGWSGSMTNKRLQDYAHLSALALRHGSPMPIDPEVVDDWGRAINPVTTKDKKTGKYNDPAPFGALESLFDPRNYPGEHVRHAYRRRLADTLGVITTTSAAVNVKLIVEPREAPPTPAIVEDALNVMRRDWMRPDGVTYPDAMQAAAAKLQLSCGFYYRWRYPKVQGAPQDEGLIFEWLETRKAWNSEVRKAIKSRKENFDSEALAQNAAQRYHGDRPITDKKLPVWGSMWWPKWRDIMHKVKYESEAIWLDDWLARDAAEWARENQGIVWYDMRAFGERVADLSGCELHGGGPDAGKLIGEVTGEQSIVASIDSHGTGRDGLQYKFRDQLIANFPSSNEPAEQLLGRLHRDGQKHDVGAKFYTHTPEVRRSMNMALISAGYVAESTPGMQKLIEAGIDLLDDFVEIEGDDEDEME